MLGIEGGHIVKKTEANDFQVKNEVGNDNPDQTVDLTPGQADKEANDILKSDETKAVLNNIKNIDERIKAINKMSATEQASYSSAVQEYEQIKKDIKQKMEEDPNFQVAMEQVGMKLDMKDQSLDKIPEPNAGEMASEALTSQETPKQLSKVNYVMSGHYMLNPTQKEALDKGLAVFKERIERVATQLGLNQQNYEVKKVA